jgi:hypothetical protein
MMNKRSSRRKELTAVDDVRRVRESIAHQHGGDLRAHVAETNRIFEQLREKLGIRVVDLTNPKQKRKGTGS